MRVLGRAKKLATKLPHARRTEEFDQAVAEFFMRIALDEAARGAGRTHPNPAVGAILVKGGRVLSRGHHRKAGTAHAEVVAIESAGAKARGADLYTTLEPCDHWGRTGPCSQAILDAGIKRVICGSEDPNPLVSGKGVERLRAAGVEVVQGVLRADADALNRPFFKFMRTGMPWVTLKAAATLDGKLATATGDSRWVTGEEARLSVHRLRNRADAILVGANTVVQDDPELTTRLLQGDPNGPARHPVRVIVDSHLRVPLGRKVFSARHPGRTIVATLESAETPKAKRLASRGVEVWTVRARGGRVNVKMLLKRLAADGLLHVMVEGGAELFGTLLREKLADELWLFLAPKLLGKAGMSWVGDLGIARMAKALETGTLDVERHGPDVLLKSLLAQES